MLKRRQGRYKNYDAENNLGDAMQTQLQPANPYCPSSISHVITVNIMSLP